MFRRRASEAKEVATVPDRGQGAGPAGHGARQDPGPRSASPVSSGEPTRSGRPASSGAEEPGRTAPAPWGPPPAGLDVSAPHPARVWNYWLGGRDFFAADKAAGEGTGRGFPPLPRRARAQPPFRARAAPFRPER